jgi:DNA repair exonuclease SbcCD ATPase subunit
MTQESEIRECKTYTFRNEDSTARTVIVEHPVRAGYKLRGDAKPIETTADWLRFRVPVDSKQTASLEIDEARPLVNTYQLTGLNTDQVELFVRQQSINKTIEQSLRRILQQKEAVSDLDSKKDATEEEMKQIYDDQQRLRENIKSLKGSAEEKLLLQRYTQQMNEQENRLDRLRKDIEQLTAKHDAAEAVLDKMIQDISFDVTI